MEKVLTSTLYRYNFHFKKKIKCSLANSFEHLHRKYYVIVPELQTQELQPCIIRMDNVISYMQQYFILLTPLHKSYEKKKQNL